MISDFLNTKLIVGQIPTVQCAMRPGHVENWKNLILYSIIVMFQILLFNSVGLFKF